MIEVITLGNYEGRALKIIIYSLVVMVIVALLVFGVAFFKQHFNTGRNETATSLSNADYMLYAEFDNAKVAGAMVKEKIRDQNTVIAVATYKVITDKVTNRDFIIPALEEDKSIIMNNIAGINYDLGYEVYWIDKDSLTDSSLVKSELGWTLIGDNLQLDSVDRYKKNIIGIDDDMSGQFIGDNDIFESVLIRNRSENIIGIAFKQIID